MGSFFDADQNRHRRAAQEAAGFAKTCLGVVGDRRSGLKLGYRKGTRGGVWVGKLVESGARVETTLGRADDDGVLRATV